MNNRKNKGDPMPTSAKYRKKAELSLDKALKEWIRSLEHQLLMAVLDCPGHFQDLYSRINMFARDEIEARLYRAGENE
jgi:hypothetical protein